jgi:HAD superfamily hydrolase (TIGR01509 family)
LGFGASLRETNLGESRHSFSTGAVTMIEAIVFDLDGVIIDSEVLWDEVRTGLAAEHGRPWPADATRAMQGMSTPEWADYLSSTVGIPGGADAIAAEVLDRMARQYSGALPVLPGAVDTVRALAKRWPLGLASSSSRSLIDIVLAAADLTQYFAVTLSTEEVSAGKPSPVVYLEAARLLGVEPAKCVAIEDSSNGLRSAAAAGMQVVAVPMQAYPPAPSALELALVAVMRIDEVTPELIDNLH